VAGLTLLPLLPLLAALGALGAPGQPEALHSFRLAELLAAPRPADPVWRGMLFQSASRLDHAPSAAVLAAWEALAVSGADGDLSNLILYRRRAGLPLPAEAVSEGVDSALERALAAWGAGDTGTALAGLQDGLRRWPADTRLASNLDWLTRNPPAHVAATADTRALAQAVLAARNALP
jgi:hypothetical protein